PPLHIIHLFLVPSPAHHRSLPSFPTRRSSDLPHGGAQPPHRAARFRERVLPHPDRRQRRPGVDDTLGSFRGSKRSARSLCLARTDRKSTRLNSSHLGISYAVFCLKKKNTQHRS